MAKTGHITLQVMRGATSAALAKSIPIRSQPEGWDYAMGT